MKIKSTNKFSVLLFFCLLNLVSFSGFCDLIHLKTGEAIEGIIEKEDEASITLNIGSGTVSLAKSEIDRISQYTPEEQDALKKRWSAKYFTSPEYIPEGLKDVVDEFKNIENARKIAIERKRIADKDKKRVKELEEENKQLRKELNDISAKISTMKSQDNIEEYNSLIEKTNALFSKIQLIGYDKEMLDKEVISLNKWIFDYINDLSLFRKKFMERYDGLEAKPKADYAYFFDGIKKKMEEMEKDFILYEIDYNRYGSTIFVEALLNGVVKVNFIVDTGASIVILSREVADKLEIGFSEGGQSLDVALADGSKVKARSVILRSIKVGNAVVENVPAAVIEKRGATAEDGLLGMSFLKNFIVKINTKSNKLILEEFNP